MNLLTIRDPDPPGLAFRDLDPETAILWRLPQRVPLLAEEADEPETSAEAITRGVRRLLSAQPNHPDGPAFQRFARKQERGLWNDLESSRTAGDWRAMIRPLELMLAIDPDDARAHCDLAIAYRRTGKPDLAERSYRRAIALAPDLAVAQTGLGGLLFEQGQNENAISFLRHSLAVREQQPGAHYYLGRALGIARDDEQAAAHLARAAELLPTDPRPAYFLAIARIRLDDYPGALQAIDQALAIDPLLPDAGQVRESIVTTIALHSEPTQGTGR